MTSRLTIPFLTATSEPARLGRGFALLLSMLAGVAGLGLYELRSLGERQQQQAALDAQRSRQGQELLATVSQVGLLARQTVLSAASPEGRADAKPGGKTDPRTDPQAEAAKAEGGRPERAGMPRAATASTAQRLAEAQDRAAALELALRGATAQAAPAWLAGQLDDLASARAQTLQLLTEAQRQARDGRAAEALHTLTARAELAETRWRSLAEELVRQLDLHGAAAQKTAQEARQRQLLQFFAWSLTALLLGAALAWNAVQRLREALQRNLRTVAGPASKAAAGARSGGFSRAAAADAPTPLAAVGSARAASGPGAQAGPAARAAATVSAPGSSLLRRREAERDWSALDRLAGALTRAGSTVHAPAGSGAPTKAALPSTPAANEVDLPVPLPGATAPSSPSAPAASTAAADQGLTTALPPLGLPTRPREELLRDAVAAASRGGLVVSQVVANIEDIGATGRRIAEIVAVIDSIAFQTNLLALNAVVEAAHAEARDAAPLPGSAQAGQSVAAGVAADVRSLAQRATQAAREIKALIAAGAPATAGEGASASAASAALQQDASQTMDALLVSVQKAADLVAQVRQAAQGDEGALNQSLEQLERLQNSHSALAEQSASSAESLRQQAERLQKVLGAFKLLQQTQQAAWGAHNAIRNARDRARFELGADSGFGTTTDPAGGWGSLPAARKGGSGPAKPDEGQAGGGWAPF
jgi:hypothetical protein